MDAVVPGQQRYRLRMAAFEGADRARAALTASGIDFTLTTHGPVNSLEEAAAARGLRPEDIVRTIVVRRGPGDYLFVLVPGGRQISWPKLRALLGVNKMKLPSAEEAREVTGYERGTITPFGSLAALPVIADATVTGRPVSLGAGAHGVAATVDADALLRVLGATVADVSDGG